MRMLSVAALLAILVDPSVAAPVNGQLAELIGRGKTEEAFALIHDQKNDEAKELATYEQALRESPWWAKRSKEWDWAMALADRIRPHHDGARINPGPSLVVEYAATTCEDGRARTPARKERLEGATLRKWLRDPRREQIVAKPPTSCQKGCCNFLVAGAWGDFDSAVGRACFNKDGSVATISLVDQSDC